MKRLYCVLCVIFFIVGCTDYLAKKEHELQVREEHLRREKRLMEEEQKQEAEYEKREKAKEEKRAKARAGTFLQPDSSSKKNNLSTRSFLFPFGLPPPVDWAKREAELYAQAEKEVDLLLVQRRLRFEYSLTQKRKRKTATFKKPPNKSDKADPNEGEAKQKPPEKEQQERDKFEEQQKELRKSILELRKAQIAVQIGREKLSASR